MAAKQQQGKPKFIRKNGKIIPIGVDKKKGKTVGGVPMKKGKFSKGTFKGLTEKQATKSIERGEEKSFGRVQKRNKKRIKFGAAVGATLGAGVAIAGGRGGLLKKALIGAGLGAAAILPTVESRSRGDIESGKLETNRQIRKFRKKNAQGF